MVRKEMRTYTNPMKGGIMQFPTKSADLTRHEYVCFCNNDYIWQL